MNCGVLIPLKICCLLPFLDKRLLTGIAELNLAVDKLMDDAWFCLQGVQICHLKFKVIINNQLNVIKQMLVTCTMNIERAKFCLEGI